MDRNQAIQLAMTASETGHWKPDLDDEAVRAFLFEFTGKVVAETLMSVIQRLNQNPYSLTKSECISEVLALSDKTAVADCEAGDDPVIWAVRFTQALGKPWGNWMALTSDEQLNTYRNPNPYVQPFELRQFRALPEPKE